MFISYSSQYSPHLISDSIRSAMDLISADRLRATVERVSIPRDYQAEPENNRQVAEWIEARLRECGYKVDFQGDLSNIIALPPDAGDKPLTIIATHYDSVAGCPGADDNGSGIAAVIELAQALAELNRHSDAAFIVFNAEEDHLRGSRDFVARFRCDQPFTIREIHVLEMIGFCSHTPGSQRVPPGLPVKAPDVGDFIGVIANRTSNHLIDGMMQLARSATPDLPAVALKIPLGAENLFPVLKRSDHAPFWDAGIPALMWTDTSEFRNPHYHSSTDTPETLDYDFLHRVTQLLLARAISNDL